MPNQRKKDKKLVGFFADPQEYAAIQKLAKAHAISVAELLRRIANGTIKLGLWVLGLVGLAHMALTLAGASAGRQAAAQARAAAGGSPPRHAAVFTPPPGGESSPHAACAVAGEGGVG